MTQSVMLCGRLVMLCLGSIAQCGKGASAAFVHGLQTDWRTVTFVVDRVYLISRRDFDDPFHVRYEVPIDGSEPVAVTEEYSAGTGGPVAAAAGSS